MFMSYLIKYVCICFSNVPKCLLVLRLYGKIQQWQSALAHPLPKNMASSNCFANFSRVHKKHWCTSISTFYLQSLLILLPALLSPSSVNLDVLLKNSSNGSLHLVILSITPLNNTGWHNKWHISTYYNSMIRQVGKKMILKVTWQWMDPRDFINRLLAPLPHAGGVMGRN